MLKKISLIAFCLVVWAGPVWAGGFATPEAALNAYNAALLNGDPAAAYTVLSPADRAVMSLEEFTARYAAQFETGFAYRLETEAFQKMKQETGEMAVKLDFDKRQDNKIADYSTFNDCQTQTKAVVEAFPSSVADFTNQSLTAGTADVFKRQVALEPLSGVNRTLVDNRASMPEKESVMTPSAISHPATTMSDALAARDLTPDSQLVVDDVRVVNVITLRQENDGWYVFHNRVAEAKLEELLNEALELARHDVMDNLLVARDMFAQAFAMEGFESLKNAYRQSYQYVRERISFLAVQNAYHEQLRFIVTEVAPFDDQNVGPGVKYKVSLLNHGDRQLRMLSFKVKLLDAADSEVCNDLQTVTFDNKDALPGSEWQSDYFELTGLTVNPDADVMVQVEIAGVYLRN